jgi:predicted GTPase
MSLSKEKLSEKYKAICLIGVTGTGKSSTGNSLIVGDYFKVSDSASSETGVT